MLLTRAYMYITETYQHPKPPAHNKIHTQYCRRAHQSKFSLTPLGFQIAAPVYCSCASLNGMPLRIMCVCVSVKCVCIINQIMFSLPNILPMLCFFLFVKISRGRLFIIIIIAAGEEFLIRNSPYIV